MFFQRLSFASRVMGGSLFFLLFSYLAPVNAVVNYVVTNTADSGAGSLRDAINSTNSDPGPNSITFNISGTGPFLIQPGFGVGATGNPLPTIITPVTIDGYSQPGTSQNTATDGSTNAELLIEINGNNYSPVSGVGLLFGPGSDSSTVQGIVFNEFLFAAVNLFDSANHVIVGNFFGTTVHGTLQLANSAGVFCNGTVNSVIGGFDPVAFNLFAGSFGDFVTGGASIGVVGSTGTQILGNLIGTELTGTYALGNSINGIFVEGSSNVQILGNLISGQTAYGIQCIGVIDCLIEGNYIGTDLFGVTAIPNLNAGIQLIGGPQPSYNNTIFENLISGNGKGVVLGSRFYPLGTFENYLSNNYIGTDWTGTQKLGNGTYGVWVFEGGNLIQGNLISGNGDHGILCSASSLETIIKENQIGTDVTGTHPLGNGGNGIQIGLQGGKNSSLLNQIIENTIAFNRYGVAVGASFTDQESLGNSILNNSIFGNKNLGIYLHKLKLPYEPEKTTFGPNQFQTSPKLTYAKSKSNSTYVKGKLKSLAHASYLIQFFGNNSGKAGQGTILLGEYTVKTDGNGNARFSTNIGTVAQGSYISSTATRLSGSNVPGETSEFSNLLKVKS